jgi:hypothetical protein
MAWPFAFVSIWVLFGGLTRNRLVRIACRIAGTVAIGLILWRVYAQINPLPYDLADSREANFLRLLEKPLSGSRDTLRVGCVPWSERSCVAAGRFLIKFSKAGWTIDSNRVFRVDAQIPTDGVTICTNKPPPTNLPPYLGEWQAMNPSHVTIACALLETGIRVAGASDISLPTGTLGVYFGPEPSSLISTNKTVQKGCESAFAGAVH